MVKEIQETITQFVTEILLRRGIKAQPSPDMSLIESGLIDSSSIVMLVGKLEESFGISIAMSDLSVDNFDTIQLIRELVRSKITEK